MLGEPARHDARENIGGTGGRIGDDPFHRVRRVIGGERRRGKAKERDREAAGEAQHADPFRWAGKSYWLTVQSPAVALALRANLRPDHAGRLAALAGVPERRERALVRAIAAAVIDDGVAAMIKQLVPVSERLADVAKGERLRFLFRSQRASAWAPGGCYPPSALPPAFRPRGCRD